MHKTGSFDGHAGTPFSPEQLAADFGSNHPRRLAVRGVHALCEALQGPGHRQARASFSQWKILFGEACGRDLDSSSEELRQLARFYQCSTQKPAELLFALQTYYALFLKLLAAKILGLMPAGPHVGLKKWMQTLEAGRSFRDRNITN